ncbi:hypothetical protein E2562_029035 [Oryza meyeriana var. granulata]|uniref:Uncharacterized protein n=1 Tax=Oryza meyeriana var. granulata TaxID=110450 RepID=A0A6G1E3L9_9ORYZ|nr:hypothetical protein E2562_029035 [Oryza meyeriana var. granulata]
MGEDARMVLALALTGGVFVALLSLLVVVLVRRWWRRREAVASSRGFVLFGICFNDKQSQQCRVVRPSMERNRRWPSRERHPSEAEDDQEPDQCELERWKRMFGGPARSLSTIDEETEKGTTPITTPAFCSPATSPDRRDARPLQMTSIAVQS